MIVAIPLGSIHRFDSYPEDYIRVSLAPRRWLVRLRLSDDHLQPAALLWQAVHGISSEMGILGGTGYFRGRFRHLRGGTELRRVNHWACRCWSRLRRALLGRLYCKHLRYFLFLNKMELLIKVAPLLDGAVVFPDSSAAPIFWRLGRHVWLGSNHCANLGR